MDIQLLFICGIVAGVLSIFAYLPYIIEALKGQTQPQRSTWFIWSVLSSMSFFAQVMEGATDSLWFSGVQASGTILVAVLSIRFGTGNFLNRADSFILMGAASGLCLWYLTDDAVYALAISIGISALGSLLTIAKAYRDPDSESILSWLVSFTSTIFAIISVGKLDPVILAYPMYLFVLYGSIIAAISLGKMMGNNRKIVTDSIPVVKQPVVFRTLVNSHSMPGMHYDLQALNDDKITTLVSSLKKRGVREHVLNDALRDVVHG